MFELNMANLISHDVEVGIEVLFWNVIDPELDALDFAQNL
jgi:hypothetical protein